MAHGIRHTQVIRAFSRPQSVCPHQCARAFSSTKLRMKQPATNTGLNSGYKKSMKRQNQQSVSSAQKQGMRDSTQDDFGLMPDIFIMPRFSKRPWVFTKAGRVFFKARFMNYWYTIQTTIGWKFSKLTGTWTPIGLRGITKVANDTHRAINEAQASGDVQNLKDITAEGLYGTISARVNRRPRDERQTWRIKRRNSPTRLVYLRAFPMPVETPKDEPCWLLQAVFKIDTVQELEKIGGIKALNPVKGTGVRSQPHYHSFSPVSTYPDAERMAMQLEKFAKVLNRVEDRAVEYLVLQRRLWFGKLEPWKAWGFAEETSLQTLLDRRKEKDLELKEENEAAKKKGQSTGWFAKKRRAIRRFFAPSDISPTM